MRYIFGPALYLREPTSNPGTQLKSWNFSLSVWIADVHDNDATQWPALRFEGPNITVSAPRIAATLAGYTSIQWDIAAERRDTEYCARYTVCEPGTSTPVAAIHGPDPTIDVVIPAQNQLPNIAFFSCNGVDDPKNLPRQADRLWDTMLERHSITTQTDSEHFAGYEEDGCSYHILIGGGDQVYADVLWDRIPELRWRTSWNKRKESMVSEPFKRELEKAYVDLYIDRWGTGTFSKLLRRIPTLMTWDDHDIFDGWGSYPKSLTQNNALFQAMFEAARKAFCMFQLGGDPLVEGPRSPTVHSADSSHFLQTICIDNTLDIVLLDLRSGRTPERVMAQAQWDALIDWLNDRQNETGRHLLVVSSIPVVYLNLHRAESALRFLPGRYEWEDDLRDQWESVPHLGERARLIMRLLDHAHASKSRVTILSGDVHLGARARIQSTRPSHLIGNEDAFIIPQLTSSAIVYPPPSRWERAGLRFLADAGPKEVEFGVVTYAVDAAPNRFFIAENNWLSIEPDAKKRLWVRWIVREGKLDPPILVHPRAE